MSKLRHLKESKIVPQERYLPPWKHTPGIHRGYNIFFYPGHIIVLTNGVKIHHGFYSLKYTFSSLMLISLSLKIRGWKRHVCVSVSKECV